MCVNISVYVNTYLVSGFSGSKRKVMFYDFFIEFFLLPFSEIYRFCHDLASKNIFHNSIEIYRIMFYYISIDL